MPFEYDVSFEEPDDAYDRLKKNYDELQLSYGELFVEHKKLKEGHVSKEKYDTLVERYLLVHTALVARIEDEKGRSVYLIDKHTKNSNDLSTELVGLKQTKERDLMEDK
jgi:hypothetical protein